MVFRFLGVSDSFLSVMDIFCGVQMPVVMLTAAAELVKPISETENI